MNKALVYSYYKEPLNANFNDCTKDILAELQAEESSESEEIDENDWKNVFQKTPELRTFLKILFSKIVLNFMCVNLKHTKFCEFSKIAKLNTCKN